MMKRDHLHRILLVPLVVGLAFFTARSSCTHSTVYLKTSGDTLSLYENTRLIFHGRPEEVKLIVPDECYVKTADRDYYLGPKAFSLLAGVFPDSLWRVVLLGGVFNHPAKFLVTAYCWTGQRTSRSTWPKPNYTVAVDPRIIPLGSWVRIDGHGWFYAEDTGDSIQGNRLDIFMPTRLKALWFGVRELNVSSSRIGPAVQKSREISQ